MYGRKGYQLPKDFASGEKGHLKPFNVREQIRECKLFDETIEECDQNHHLIQFLIRHLSLSICIYFTNKVFCLIEGVDVTRKMEQEGLDVHNNRNADHYGALVHHLSLIHNKRCLMAYVSVRYHFSFCYQRLSQFVKNDIGVGVCRHNRADIVRDLAWRVGLELLDLPPEIQDKLTTLEKRVLQEPFCSYQIVHGKSRNRVECRKQFGFNFAWWGLYYTTRDMVPPKEQQISPVTLCISSNELMLNSTLLGSFLYMFPP
ncbi:hypothetical protein YC2023_091488 [Brassica napus]